MFQIASYTAEISQLIELVQQAADVTIKRIGKTDNDLLVLIKEYLVTIDLLRLLAQWIDFAGDETGTADVSYAAAEEVEKISDKLVEERDAKIVERLAQVNFFITDESQLTTIIGAAGFRIEQVRPRSHICTLSTLPWLTAAYLIDHISG